MASEPRTQTKARDRGDGAAEEVARALSSPGPVIGNGRAVYAFAALLLATVGCMQTPAQKAEADLASVKKEHNAEVLLERGKAFAAVGDLTRAEEYLAAALENGSDPRDTLPLLFDVCIKGQRYRSAIQHGETHLRRHPTDTRTRLFVGTLYTVLGEAKSAKHQLEVVVDTHPNDSQAHYALAILARDTENDVVNADRHFREYLRIEPNGAHAEEARASLLQRVEQGVEP